MSISSLVSHLDGGNVKLSILGEDIVGSEKVAVSEEDVLRRRRRFIKFYAAFYIALIITTILTSGFGFIMMNEGIHYKHTEAIADLYLKAKDFDSAIKAYEDLRKNYMILNNMEPVIYNLARIHALKGDTLKSMKFLEELIGKSHNFEKLIQQDTSFDAITSRPEFQELLKKLKGS